MAAQLNCTACLRKVKKLYFRRAPVGSFSSECRNKMFQARTVTIRIYKVYKGKYREEIDMCIQVMMIT